MYLYVKLIFQFGEKVFVCENKIHIWLQKYQDVELLIYQTLSEFRRYWMLYSKVDMIETDSTAY